MRRVPLLLLCAAIARPVAAGQPPLDMGAALTFYGDNTELSNPFREGETLVGTFAEVFLEAEVSDRLSLRGGVFGHQRFGSDRRFDEVRPVLALVIGGRRSRLILGTLETLRRIDGPGPDRTGPHPLLPPVQRETLAFDRPWEAGLQWTSASARLTHDAWVHWQRRNTPAQRERFDVGLAARLRLHRALTLRTDVHVVHEGGQLSAAGPVRDSTAVTVGLATGGPAGRIDRVLLEGFAVASRFVPDRARQEDSETGIGAFVRASAEEGGWRAHGILWRAADFIKAEGDLHYQALRSDGTRFRNVRDYAEAGLTRTFPLAEGAFLEASARWHRVESAYEYSFRILAVARLRHTIF